MPIRRSQLPNLRILAIDTSSEYCSVALWRDGEIDAREVHAGHRHSELLLGMIDDLLAQHGLKVRALDAIAFGEGPGSFTGLRIGCGVTQGLAFAVGIPVVGIDTLLAMALAAQADRVVCCVDARVREIYHGAYERTGDAWRTVCAPSVCPAAAAPDLPGGSWFGGGSGFTAYREALTLRYEGQLAGIDGDLHARAREIAQLAVAKFESGQGVDASLAAPVYIRDRVALKTSEQR